MSRVLAVAALLLAAAGSALADPVLERVESSLSRGGRLTVVVEATFDGRGELRVDGTVNGREVHVRKRVRRAGVRRLRARIDPRRLRLRRLSEPLTFDLRVVAASADGPRVERAVARSVAVPLVVLPGLGNEQTPAIGETLVAAIGLFGEGYEMSGRRPNAVLHAYPSLDGTLRSHAKALRKRVRRMLRGATFRRVDVVGYSMGGLVARRWLADGGAAKARRVVFLGTPNQGAPLAQLASLGLQGDALAGVASLLAPGLGDIGVLGDLIGGVVDTESASETLRTFYPTYPWAFVTIDVPVVGPRRVALTPELISTFGALVPGLAAIPFDLASPLTALNDIPPATDVEYFAIGYTELVPDVVGGGFGTLGIGTVDEIDLGGILAGESIDLASLASGDGDGIVPWRSLVMDDTPVWRSAIDSTDLGAGTHVTLPADPRAIARILEILAE